MSDCKDQKYNVFSDSFDTDTGTNVIDDPTTGSQTIITTVVDVEAYKTIGDGTSTVMSATLGNQELNLTSTNAVSLSFAPSTNTINISSPVYAELGQDGRLAYYNGAGTRVDDAIDLFYNDTSKLLGIQTTSPTARLTVSGSTSDYLFLAESDSYNVLSLYGDGRVHVTGTVSVLGNVNVTGTLTADRLTVSTVVSSSVIYESGSTKFGDTLDDTHQITGSLLVTGSSHHFTGSIYAGYISGSDGDFTTLQADYLDLNGLASDPTYNEGRLFYNSNEHLLSYWTDLSDVHLHLGQQLAVRVQNNTGGTVAKGTFVYFTGSTSTDTPRFRIADYSSEETADRTIGVTMTQTDDGDQTFALISGILTGVNTNSFASGDIIYLSSSGGFTNVEPSWPNHAVKLGEVVRKQSVNGSILVNIDAGGELEDVHDVVLQSTSSGDLLVASNGYWQNTKQLTGSYGLTGSLYVTNTISSSIYIGPAQYLTAPGSSYSALYKNASGYVAGSTRVFMSEPNYIALKVRADASGADYGEFFKADSKYARVLIGAVSGALGNDSNVTSYLHVSSSDSTTVAKFDGPSTALEVTGAVKVTGSMFITGSLTVSGSSTFTNIGPAVFSVPDNTTSAFYVTSSTGDNNWKYIDIDTTTDSESITLRGHKGNYFSIFESSGNTYLSRYLAHGGYIEDRLQNGSAKWQVRGSNTALSQELLYVNYSPPSSVVRSKIPPGSNARFEIINPSSENIIRVSGSGEIQITGSLYVSGSYLNNTSSYFHLGNSSNHGSFIINDDLATNTERFKIDNDDAHYNSTVHYFKDLTAGSTLLRLSSNNSIFENSIGYVLMNASSVDIYAYSRPIILRPDSASGNGIVQVTGTIDVTTNITASGHVSASIFYGDGSGLSGVSATPGGSDTHIQFNDGGSFGGSANLTWDDTNFKLTGSLIATGSSHQITGSLNVINNGLTGHSFKIPDNGTGTNAFKVTMGSQDLIEARYHVAALRNAEAHNSLVLDRSSDSYLKAPANDNKGFITKVVGQWSAWGGDGSSIANAYGNAFRVAGYIPDTSNDFDYDYFRVSAALSGTIEANLSGSGYFNINNKEGDKTYLSISGSNDSIKLSGSTIQISGSVFKVGIPSDDDWFFSGSYNSSTSTYKATMAGGFVYGQNVAGGFQTGFNFGNGMYAYFAGSGGGGTWSVITRRGDFYYRFFPDALNAGKAFRILQWTDVPDFVRIENSSSQYHTLLEDTDYTTGSVYVVKGSGSTAGVTEYFKVNTNNKTVSLKSDTISLSGSTIQMTGSVYASSSAGASRIYLNSSGFYKPFIGTSANQMEINAGSYGIYIRSQGGTKTSGRILNENWNIGSGADPSHTLHVRGDTKITGSLFVDGDGGANQITGSLLVNNSSSASSMSKLFFTSGSKGPELLIDASGSSGGNEAKIIFDDGNLQGTKSQIRANQGLLYLETQMGSGKYVRIGGTTGNGYLAVSNGLTQVTHQFKAGTGAASNHQFTGSVDVSGSGYDTNFFRVQAGNGDWSGDLIKAYDESANPKIDLGGSTTIEDLYNTETTLSIANTAQSIISLKENTTERALIDRNHSSNYLRIYEKEGFLRLRGTTGIQMTGSVDIAGNLTASGATHFNIPDNNSNAFSVVGDGHEYIKIDTADGSETITLKPNSGSAYPVLDMDHSYTRLIQTIGNYFHLTGTNFRIYGSPISNVLYLSNAYWQVTGHNNGTLETTRIDQDANFFHALTPASSSIFSIEQWGSPHAKVGNYIAVSSSSDTIQFSGSTIEVTGSTYFDDEVYIKTGASETPLTLQIGSSSSTLKFQGNGLNTLSYIAGSGGGWYHSFKTNNTIERFLIGDNYSAFRNSVQITGSLDVSTDVTLLGNLKAGNHLSADFHTMSGSLFITGSDTPFNINDDIIYKANNGYLSLGAGTTPQEKLDVDGNILASGRIKATTSITASTGLQVDSGPVLFNDAGDTFTCANTLVLGTSFADAHQVTGSLNVSGNLNVVYTATVGSLVETSERSLKKDIRTQNSQLYKIMKLNPVDFNWKNTNKKSKGFIAEEVEEIYPELVSKDEKGNPKGIEYTKLVSVLTQGVKELNEKVREQEKTIQKLIKLIEEKNK